MVGIAIAMPGAACKKTKGGEPPVIITPPVVSNCLTNMNDMVSRYAKEVMICEVGMSWDSPDICKAFIADLITKVKSVPDNKCLGVLYWEPQAYGNWQGYTLGAFDNSGKLTVALDAFK